MATLEAPDGLPVVSSPKRRSTKRRAYSRHGLNPLKAKVKVAGLAALDRRTVAARSLLDWRSDLIADLGGDQVVSAQQMALVEIAARTKLYVDHLDAFLMDQRSLVNAKKRASLPVLRERQTLADSLARILSQLGLERRQAPAKSIHEFIAEKVAQRGPTALQLPLSDIPDETGR